MSARINENELLVTAVAGEVTSPSMAMNPYEVAADGTPVVPVGAGGICYNVKVGMGALGWAGDQVEPGVSIANPAESANEALNVFACVGNHVVVRSGAAAGAAGVVTGKHEAFMSYKHVLVHIEDAALEQVVPGDLLLVRGLRARHARDRSAGRRVSQPRPRALARLVAGGARRPTCRARHARAPARGDGDGHADGSAQQHRSPSSAAFPTATSTAFGSATSSPSATGTRRTTPATARVR